MKVWFFFPVLLKLGGKTIKHIERCHCEYSSSLCCSSNYRVSECIIDHLITNACFISCRASFIFCWALSFPICLSIPIPCQLLFYGCFGVFIPSHSISFFSGRRLTIPIHLSISIIFCSAVFGAMVNPQGLWHSYWDFNRLFPESWAPWRKKKQQPEYLEEWEKQTSPVK